MDTLKSILDQIDEAIASYNAARANAHYDDLGDLNEAVTTEIAGRLVGTLERLAPSGTYHRRSLERLLENSGLGYPIIQPTLGALKTLRHEYERGYFRTVQELVHAEMFSGFLDMASYLQQSGYKDAAAVIAGSVLEQHLRELADKNAIPVVQNDKPVKAETLNTLLAAADVYSKLDQKNVTSWLGLRNDAAHGNYEGYSQQQSRLMIDSVTDFLARNPA